MKQANFWAFIFSPKQLTIHNNNSLNRINHIFTTKKFLSSLSKFYLHVLIWMLNCVKQVSGQEYDELMIMGPPESVFIIPQILGALCLIGLLGCICFSEVNLPHSYSPEVHIGTEAPDQANTAVETHQVHSVVLGLHRHLGSRFQSFGSYTWLLAPSPGSWLLAPSRGSWSCLWLLAPSPGSWLLAPGPGC